MTEVVNFVHPRMREEGFEKSTVGRQILYYCQALSELGIVCQVNGCDVDVLFSTPPASNKRDFFLQSLSDGLTPRFKLFVRDFFRVFNPKQWSSSDFVRDVPNVVFQSPFMSSADWWSQFNVVLLFDEPPVVGVNVSNFGFEAIWKHRLRQTVRRSQVVWCYHDAAHRYISNLDDQASIKKLPCFMRNQATPPFKASKFKNLEIGDYHIAIVSSFLPWHGIVEFVESFALSGRGVLHLIGDGVTKQRCERIANGYENIKFHGALEQSDLDKVLEGCHIGIVPQIPWFNCPLKIHDYGAHGLVCIAPPSLGIVSLYNEDEVLFFDDSVGVMQTLEQVMALEENALSRFAERLHTKIATRFNQAEYSRALRSLIFLADNENQTL